jgi:ABC-type uncharacterized transport system involved in gliding motility auxiliary subunit
MNDRTKALIRQITLGAGVVGAVLVLAGVGWYSITHAFDWPQRVLVGAGGILLVLYLYGHLETLGAFARTRTARAGANTLVMTVAFIGIVVILNWLSYRYNWRWDLTREKAYTLAPQTREILRSLDKDIQVRAFFVGGDPLERDARDLLKEYQRASPHIKVEFIDPDRQPGLADRYNIRVSGTTVFELGDRRETASIATEQEYTSAILKLTRGVSKKIYFVEGHGERALDDSDRAGYSGAAQLMRRENYTVEKLQLPAVTAIPEDAVLLVMPSPRQRLGERELAVLRNYLRNGGKLLLMVEPGIETGLNDILAEYGVRLGEGFVVETDPQATFFGDPVSLYIGGSARVGAHRITNNLIPVVLAGARPLEVAEQQPEGVSITRLLQSTQRSWIKVSLGNQLDETLDKRGPATVAVAIYKGEETSPAASSGGTAQAAGEEKKAASTRLVVIGDADFASNVLLPQSGDQDLLMNSVNWLAEEESLISIRARSPSRELLNLSAADVTTIFLLTVVVMPGVMLVLALMKALQRR